MKGYQMTSNEFQNNKKAAKMTVFALFPIYFEMTLSFSLFNFYGNAFGLIFDPSRLG
jgi:hypothetical protein